MNILSNTRASAMALLLMVAATCIAHADDFSDCMQGLDGYQAHLPELENARAECAAEDQRLRNDPSLSEEELEAALQQQCPAKQRVCDKIQPEVGHAACEGFLQNRGGNENELASASQANDILKPLYDECTAQ